MYTSTRYTLAMAIYQYKLYIISISYLLALAIYQHQPYTSTSSILTLDQYKYQLNTSTSTSKKLVVFNNTNYTFLLYFITIQAHASNQHLAYSSSLHQHLRPRNPISPHPFISTGFLQVEEMLQRHRKYCIHSDICICMFAKKS